MPHEWSRREMLGAFAVSAAGLALPRWTQAASLLSPAPAGRVARIAHLTDIHIQPELAAAEGLAACLKHVQSQADKPDLIVTGGDLIMDGFESDEARTKLQWDLFIKTFRDHCSLRVEQGLGNHDIWGWNKGKSKTTGDEARWGKKWALETLGLPNSYRAFDLGNWRVIMLDSVHVDPANPSGYIGKLDAAQVDWLKAELAASKGKHVLVVSHIPILTVTVILGAANAKNERPVDPGLMHVDSAALRGILESSGNVRACVSGHTHRIDRVEFRGVKYFCNGAVCGSWWKGPRAEAVEGYALLDLYEDGRIECGYNPYGWEAKQ